MTERRTDGTSAFNTRTVGRDVSSFLIHQGEERLIEIQQHDGVVVEIREEFLQGFAKQPGRCIWRERERGGGQQLWSWVRPALVPPPLYIGGGEAP